MERASWGAVKRPPPRCAPALVELRMCHGGQMLWDTVVAVVMVMVIMLIMVLLLVVVLEAVVLLVVGQLTVIGRSLGAGLL